MNKGDKLSTFSRSLPLSMLLVFLVLISFQSVSFAQLYPNIKVSIEAYGKDETDGSDVAWISRYPYPSFSDDPTRKYSPNAKWQGDYFWQAVEHPNFSISLCLVIKNLEAPDVPTHTLAIGYTVTLDGGTFSDGSTKKTFILYRYSGVPTQKEITKCYRINVTGLPAQPDKACGFSLGSGIFNKWKQMGAESGILGCPIMNEIEAGRSPQGTTGRFAEFRGGDGGYIMWHRIGSYASRAFEVHGCIFKLYKRMGGTNSWLGFPISDEFDVPGGRVSNFEGGYIFWDAQTTICSPYSYFEREEQSPPPKEDLPEDWEANFTIETWDRRTIRAATGGTLELSNGAKIDIPAGALPSDTTITFAKIDLSQYTFGDKSVYRIDAGDIKIQKPATLILPYGDLTKKAKASDVKVIRVDIHEGVQELSALLDRDTSTIRFQTEHFCWFFLKAIYGLKLATDVAYYTYIFAEAYKDINRRRILPVPYYTQSWSTWCFAAASQMMLKYYGIEGEPWDMGIAFNLKYNKSASLLKYLLGLEYHSFFKSKKLPIKETKMWAFPPSIYGYIIEHIDAGHPVLLFVQQGTHAITIVGYDYSGVYIHDPLGNSIYTGKGGDIAVKKKIIERKSMAHIQNELACSKLSWEEFKHAMFAYPISRDISVLIPAPVCSFTFNNVPRPPNPPISMNLENSENLNRCYLKVSRQEDEMECGFYLKWDGTHGWGYRWTPFNDPSTDSISNSDVSRLFKVTVHNAGKMNINNASLEVYIDSDKNSIWRGNVKINPLYTNEIIELFTSEEPFRFKTDTPEGILKPGFHELIIKLFNKSHKLVDEIRFSFEIAPAKPEGLDKTVEPDGRVKLSWKPNPEERLPNVDIIYDLYLDEEESLMDKEKRPVASLEETSLYVTIMGNYHIVARDKATGLKSPPSEPLEIKKESKEVFELVDTRIEKIPVERASLEYHEKYNPCDIKPGEVYQQLSSPPEYKNHVVTLYARWKVPKVLPIGEEIPFKISTWHIVNERNKHYPSGSIAIHVLGDHFDIKGEGPYNISEITIPQATDPSTWDDIDVYKIKTWEGAKEIKLTLDVTTYNCRTKFHYIYRRK